MPLNRLDATAAVLAATFGVLAAHPAAAYEIYKWVDGDGVVHYSQSRPAAAATPVETVSIPERNPPGYDPGEQYRAAVAEAERIRSELDERRAERQAEAERERARAAEERLAELERRVAAAEEAAYSARPLYASPGFLHHRFPGHRPPPRRPRDPAPGEGWPGPWEPQAPPEPGFRAPAD